MRKLKIIQFTLTTLTTLIYLILTGIPFMYWAEISLPMVNKLLLSYLFMQSLFLGLIIQTAIGQSFKKKFENLNKEIN